MFSRPRSVPAMSGLVAAEPDRHRRPVALLVEVHDPPAQLTPHSCCVALENRSVLNGITNSMNQAPSPVAHFRVPDAIPVLIGAAAGGHLGVAPCARRIDDEREAGSPVVQAVDEDLHQVGRAEIEVLSQILDQQLVGLCIEAGHADVEVVVVVDEAGLGALGRRGAVARKLLKEVVGGRRLCPDGLVETPVERDRLGDPDRRHDSCCADGLVIDLDRLRESGEDRYKADHESAEDTCHVEHADDTMRPWAIARRRDSARRALMSALCRPIEALSSTCVSTRSATPGFRNTHAIPVRACAAYNHARRESRDSPTS